MSVEMPKYIVKYACYDEFEYHVMKLEEYVTKHVTVVHNRDLYYIEEKLSLDFRKIAHTETKRIHKVEPILIGTFNSLELAQFAIQYPEGQKI